MTEIKQILFNIRITACLISRKTVVSVGTGVLSFKCPVTMATNGGKTALSVNWGRNILKSMNWMKLRGTTEGAKRRITPALLKEFIFTSDEIQQKLRPAKTFSCLH